MVAKICVVCAAPFDARGRQKACGKQCSQINENRTAAALHSAAQRQCEACGGAFQHPSRAPVRYCSVACRYASRTKWPPRECQQCGASFRPKAATSRYCSMPCSGLAGRRRLAFTCEGCGGGFEREASDNGPWRTRFCSDDCRKRSKSRRTEKACQRCATVLPLKAYWRDARRADGHRDWCVQCCRAWVADNPNRSVAAPGQTKICTDCERSQPLEAFGPNRLGRFGRSPQCRACKRAEGAAYHEANREAVNARSRSRRERAEVREKEALWRKEHRQKPDVQRRERQYKLDWRSAHPEYRERQAAYSKDRTTELADGYVASALGLPLEVAKPLIPAKRLHLKIHRELKRRKVI